MIQRKKYENKRNTQRDQIGQFFKVSAITFIAKVAQIFGKLFGHFENHHFKEKTIVSTFLATFEEIGQLFILQSGHTGNTEKGK